VAKLHTYLNFAGNAEEALSFYRSVFGGELSSAIKFKDFPIEGVEIPEAEQEKMMHIALPIGNDLVMASDTVDAFGQQLVAGNNVYIYADLESRAEADRVFNALSAGGEVEMPISDQAWGDYFGSLKDKFGVMWMVSYSPPRE
jgi:PhnB protein